MAWMNDDGLYIKFGRDQGAVTVGGYFEDGVAGQTVLEVEFDLADLGSSSAPTILSDVVNLPKNARLEKAEVLATAVADSAGDGAKLNVGSVQRDRSTAIDIDGFIDSLAQTAMDAVGETTSITAGGTGAGTLMGNNISSSQTGYLVAYYETEAFTTGSVKVRLFFTQIS